MGRVDPKVDEPALRTAWLDQQVKRAKVRDMSDNGENVDWSSIKVSDADYDKYLIKVYKSADFKKPTNFIGMTKSVPDDDMKAALTKNAPIGRRLVARSRAASRIGDAGILRREDRQQADLHRGAEAECGRHQGQGCDDARRTGVEVMRGALRKPTCLGHSDNLFERKNAN